MLSTAAACTLLAAEASAQVGRDQPGLRQRNARADIELDFAGDVDLSFLIDYISERLGINIVYDEQVAKKKVTIKAPRAVPEKALLALLDSALQINGLALIQTGDGHWRTIVPTKDMATLSGEARPHGETTADSSGAAERGPIVTHVFTLEHVGPQKAEQTVKPFLTRDANTVVLPDRGLLIVTDFAVNMGRIERILGLADQPPKSVEMQFVAVRHSDAATLAQQTQQLLSVRARVAGGAGPASSVTAVEVIADDRTNQVVLVGPATAVAEAGQILASLDVPLTTERSPVRFYKLRYTTAAEVLDTIRAVEGEEGLARLELAPAGAQSPPATTYPTGHESTRGVIRQPPLIAPEPPKAKADVNVAAVQPDATSAETIQTRTARVTADPNTNTIIVVADLATQQIYADLIERLDQRRPQVLIETTLVILDTSEGFSLGVEISSRFGGDPEAITFSSFGLSTRDEDTGGISIVPGTGFNGAILAPDIAEVVIRALKRSSRATVLSAPRILVNDNATGTISSTTQEPFESVNASDTVATTSFGGFVEAGTTITVTPHISDESHLLLEYAIELSSFSGDRIENLPPPRSQNVLESVVTLPDGETIVAGGLMRSDSSKSLSAVPLLGELPLIAPLFQNRIDSDSEMTLFVFIRPVILQDDRFADLKYLSQLDMAEAGLPPEYPSSEPLLIQ